MGKKLIYLKLSACGERICETMADLNRVFPNNTEWCLRMDQQLWTEHGSVFLDKFRSSVQSCFEILNWLRLWAGARRSPARWRAGLSLNEWWIWAMTRDIWVMGSCATGCSIHCKQDMFIKYILLPHDRAYVMDSDEALHEYGHVSG